jgi:hypothetical protein
MVDRDFSFQAVCIDTLDILPCNLQYIYGRTCIQRSNVVAEKLDIYKFLLNIDFPSNLILMLNLAKLYAKACKFNNFYFAVPRETETNRLISIPFMLPGYVRELTFPHTFSLTCKLSQYFNDRFNNGEHNMRW